MNYKENITGKPYKVWWIPQVPGNAFEVEVETIEQGALLMNTLTNYDAFQFDNNIKPDYCNVGGLVVWREAGYEGDPQAHWEDWEDEESGESDPTRLTTDIIRQLDSKEDMQRRHKYGHD